MNQVQPLEKGGKPDAKTGFGSENPYRYGSRRYCRFYCRSFHCGDCSRGNSVHPFATDDHSTAYFLLGHQRCSQYCGLESAEKSRGHLHRLLGHFFASGCSYRCGLGADHQTWGRDSFAPDRKDGCGCRPVG